MTSITSETFHEVRLYIGQYYIDILIKRGVSILHTGLRYNENLQRGEQWTYQEAKKVGVPTRNPLQMMT